MNDYLAFRKIYREDLLHFGIKRRSGRYPWGSGERPFQGEPKKMNRKQKKQLQREEEIEARVKEKRESSYKRTFENPAEKVQLLTDSTATELLKYRDEISNKELRDALDRIKMIRELQDISRKEINEGWVAVNDVMKKVGLVNNWVKTGSDSYSTVRNIMSILDADAQRIKKK